MADGFYPSNRSRRSRDSSSIPGFNHSRRSWTTNGMHVTMETATYAGPGFSFRSASDRSNSFADFDQPSGNRTSRGGGGSGGLLGGGLLGGAINLLNNVANAQPRRQGSRARTEKHSYLVQSDASESDVTSSDDDLAYGSLPRARTMPTKSMLGRVKDRILEHGRQRRNQVNRDFDDVPRAHARDSRPDRRRYRPESPEPIRSTRPRRSTVANYASTPESSPERRPNVPLPTSNAQSSRTDQEIRMLQRAIESERKQYLDAKHHFQQASQRTLINPEQIQDLLNQVKMHASLLTSAQRRLQVFKEKHRREPLPRSQRQQPQRQPSPPREAYPESDEDDGHFEPWPTQGFRVFTSVPGSNVNSHQPLRHSSVFDPFFGFRVFDSLFAEAESMNGNARSFHFSTGSGNTGPSFRPASFTNTGTSHGAGHSRSHHHTAVPQPIHQLPRNPLRATEAARLFASYNSTWNSLSATFPAIPYPTRTLLAPALGDPSTIPHQLSHTWTAEQIMQANTALFFLIALGLTPIISDVGLVTFSHAATAEADVRGLIAVLKKEKLRWHSDRLGRRNEELPGGGINEALQRDERARAVFHGVCALMEFALGKTD